MSSTAATIKSAPHHDAASFQQEVGYQIRRLHQIATAYFLQLSKSLNITPVQYACLKAVSAMPGEDQRTIAKFVAIDRSTINSLSKRLEQRNLLQRTKIDGKRIALTLTAEGEKCVKHATKLVETHSDDLLSPLNNQQKRQLIESLRLLIEHHSLSEHQA